jgi:DNA-binding NarL/FixJ family response regulator
VVNPSLRIVLIAPSPIARAGIASLLAGHAGIEIAGAFAHPAEVESLLPELRPDVILVDADAADPREIAALAAENAAVLVLAAGFDSSEALRLGIRGVLPPDVQADELAAAIHAASAGFVLLLPEQLHSLLPADAARKLPNSGQPESLTPRETEVLRLLAEGVANKAIAYTLGISEHTVKFHVASILAKLRAGSRTEAVAIGVRRGLILL